MSFAAVTSTWAFNNAQGMQNQVFSFGGLFVDLYRTGPTGSGDFLTDFFLAAFPGYAQQAVDVNQPIVPDGTNTMETVTVGGITWTVGAYSGPPISIYGYVVTDNLGNVQFYGLIDSGPWIVSTTGQFLVLTLEFDWPFTYP